MPKLAKSAASTPDVSLSTAPITLLNAEQVMHKLGVSRTLLWSLMRKNGLPYIKYGQGRRASLRFSVESVDAWLRQNEQRHAG